MLEPRCAEIAVFTARARGTAVANVIRVMPDVIAGAASTRRHPSPKAPTTVARGRAAGNALGDEGIGEQHVLQPDQPAERPVPGRVSAAGPRRPGVVGRVE